ncbi:MAG: transposase, partial [Planctomycetes bacterium]|nr:transposase [Planctomycetota bacterium]
GVEPTNNRAERHLRPGVQTRKVSYGTRSEAGQRLRARLLRGRLGAAGVNS